MRATYSRPPIEDEDMADLCDYFHFVRVSPATAMEKKTNQRIEHVKTCGQRWPDIPQYTNENDTVLLL